MPTYTLNNKTIAVSKRNHESQGGFSLLEMVVALLILTVGLLGVASAIGYALMASNSGRTITNTKLLVVSVLEQMETLRDTGNLTFGQIANTGNVDNSGADSTFSGFPTGFQPVSTNPGPDGIWGTADDLIAPGPDGLYGTVDDVTDPTLAVPGVSRKVVISSLTSTLRRIEVRVCYTGTCGTSTDLVGVSYLNDDSHGNYVP